jgi:hypothetical protein
MPGVVLGAEGTTRAVRKRYVDVRNNPVDQGASTWRNMAGSCQNIPDTWMETTSAVMKGINCFSISRTFI